MLQVWQFQPTTGRWLAPLILSGEAATHWQAIYGSGVFAGFRSISGAYWSNEGGGRLSVIGYGAFAREQAWETSFGSFPPEAPGQIKTLGYDPVGDDSMPSQVCDEALDGDQRGCQVGYPQNRYRDLGAAWLDGNNDSGWAVRNIRPDPRLGQCLSRFEALTPIASHVGRLGLDELDRSTVFIEERGPGECTGAVGRTGFDDFLPFSSHFRGHLAAAQVRGATVYDGDESDAAAAGGFYVWAAPLSP